MLEATWDVPEREVMAERVDLRVFFLYMLVKVTRVNKIVQEPFIAYSKYLSKASKLVRRIHYRAYSNKFHFK